MKQNFYTKKRVLRGIAFALAFLLAMPATLANLSVVSADEPTIDEAVTYGDVDGDGIDNAQDALLVLQHAARIITLTELQVKAADVNGDLSIDAVDALLILQKAARIIDKYPVESDENPTETPEGTPGTAPDSTPVSTPDGVDVTATPEVTTTPMWTPIPTQEVTPSPSPRPDAPIPDVTEEDVVKGIPVEIKNLNGATYDEEERMITFTDENAEYREGVEIINPIKQNQDMIDDYGYLRDLEVEGLTNVFDLADSSLGWGRDENKLPVPEDQLLEDPTRTRDNRIWYRAAVDEVYYPVPRNRQGFSMSFWAKTEKEQDNSAVLVFYNATQTTSISISAIAKYNDVDNPKNMFSTDQHADKPNFTVGEWHYYTVTFANDWICIYIDGIEVPYDEIELSRKEMRGFNDGFLTRKNAVVSWTEEDYANDWQGYIQNQRGSRPEYETITSDDYTVFGNGRYRGLGAIRRLMLTFMAGKSTKVYIGGVATEAGSAAAKYQLQTGTKIAQVEYYLDELTPENARANYLYATKPND